MICCHHWPDTEVDWKILKHILIFSSCRVTMNEPKWSQYLPNKKKKYISLKTIRRRIWMYGQVYFRMELFSHWTIEIWKMSEKSLKKRMTSSEHTKFAHFWVVSVRKYIVQKYLISYRFDFLDRFFSRLFDDSVRAFS